MTATVEPGTRRGIRRAWWVAAVTMAALVAAAGFRSSTRALLEPLEVEFAWSRATTSGAVSLNLVIYGLTAAPFAAALMERFGIRGTLPTVLVAWGRRAGQWLRAGLVPLQASATVAGPVGEGAGGLDWMEGTVAPAVPVGHGGGPDFLARWVGTSDVYRVSEYVDIERPGFVASWAEDAFR